MAEKVTESPVRIIGSRELHQMGYGQLLQPQLEDHAAVARELCDQYAFIDRDRTGMWGWSNPSTEDNWWYDYLHSDLPKNARYFLQPSGFSPDSAMRMPRMNAIQL